MGGVFVCTWIVYFGVSLLMGVIDLTVRITTGKWYFGDWQGHMADLGSGMIIVAMVIYIGYWTYQLLLVPMKAMLKAMMKAGWINAETYYVKRKMRRSLLEPGFIRTYYRMVKDKVCPMIVVAKEHELHIGE
jgi:hypothetical protein